MNQETKKHLESGADIIVSVSGGKDSTACCLKLFEMGYSKRDFRRVFMDTGWEDASTYEYLDYLEKHIGKIERIRKNVDISKMPEDVQLFIQEEEKRLGHESDFIRMVFKNYCFPNSLRRYCTKALKIEPFADYLLNQENDCIVIVGLRREESRARSTITEWEWSERYQNYVWRPLYLWSEKDVIDIHSRFQVLPNNLYLQGADRVGCYPCIYSKKKHIKMLSQKRINLIDRIERFLGEYNYKRSMGKGTKLEAMLNNRLKIAGYLYHPMFIGKLGEENIHSIHEWSQTTYGGKQLALFDIEEPSCAKWGLCDFGGSYE